MKSRRWKVILLVVMVTVFAAPILFYLAARVLVHHLVIDNSGDAKGSSPPLMDIRHPEASVSNTVTRLFVKPFPGEYPVLNYFDHDRPVAPNDNNGYQLTWQGAKAQPRVDTGGYDGHMGVDWLLPEGTPLFAVTNATVFFAGKVDAPCFLENNRIVSGWQVNLEFIATDGQMYTASYYHLSEVDVKLGDLVTEGQQIGLSGATGCAGGPKGHPTAHLHLEIKRVTNPVTHEGIPIDPYGWEGPSADPWETCIHGGKSVWFWKEGQAPGMSRAVINQKMRYWLKKWF